MHALTQAQARRIAVRAQLLDARAVDGGMLAVVRHLTSLQADPVRVLATNPDLVLWSRLGAAHEPAELEQAQAAGALIELRSHLHPAEDIALYRAEMARWPHVGRRREWFDDIATWVEANDECRREVLEVLRGDGPLPASELPGTIAVPWRSSGWNDDRSLRMLLDLMVMRGEIASLGWEGRERLWDLAARVYPDDPVPSLEDAFRIRDERRLRALGIDNRQATTMQGVPLGTEPVGEPARVEGLRGTWRVDPSRLADLDAFEGRCALLSPLDGLVLDRSRMEKIFGFDYQLEMYKPAAKRRWGYWALPILYDDRLVGKLDATADREAGVLRVDAVLEDGAWNRTMRTAVEDEIKSLARWLGLTRL